MYVFITSKLENGVAFRLYVICLASARVVWRVTKHYTYDLPNPTVWSESRLVTKGSASAYDVSY